MHPTTEATVPIVRCLKSENWQTKNKPCCVLVAVFGAGICCLCKNFALCHLSQQVVLLLMHKQHCSTKTYAANARSVFRCCSWYMAVPNGNGKCQYHIIWWLVSVNEVRCHLHLHKTVARRTTALPCTMLHPRMHAGGPTSDKKIKTKTIIKTTKLTNHWLTPGQPDNRPRATDKQTIVLFNVCLSVCLTVCLSVLQVGTNLSVHV